VQPLIADNKNQLVPENALFLGDAKDRPHGYRYFLDPNQEEDPAAAIDDWVAGEVRRRLAHPFRGLRMTLSAWTKTWRPVAAHPGEDSFSFKRLAEASSRVPLPRRLAIVAG
jgi:hypothetical protein